MSELPTKKRGRGNPALTGEALNLEPGDNSRYLASILELNALPKIDKYNAEDVEKRAGEYFTMMFRQDKKPTVSGLAMAFGIDRRQLWAIVNDAPINGHGDKLNVSRLTADAYKKAYRNMEILWEDYMQNGKINPVSGIFLGKNLYGYTDKIDYVITPNTNANDYSASDIASRYLAEGDTTTEATTDTTTD